MIPLAKLSVNPQKPWVVFWAIRRKAARVVRRFKVRKEEEKDEGENEQLRLRLDLNLDIEVQLKAKIHGDLTIGLLN